VDSPLLIFAWLVLAIPIVTIIRWTELRTKQKIDYSHYVELKEFPLIPMVVGKFLCFLAIGLASFLVAAPPYKTFVALTIIGICGFAVEASVSLGRPVPTQGYMMTRVICLSCRNSVHHECTNLRMLDGFEKGFKTEEGYNRPVCCCGFRLGDWEEVEV
jgi:hypothetical protein